MASPSSTTTTSTAGCSTTASQAWAILRRHARDEVRHLRLRELCRSDERVSALVSVYNAQQQQPHNNNNNDTNDAATPSTRMIMVDLSRQLLTLDTINKLLCLATARDVPKRIRQLAWGPSKISSSSSSSSSFPSYHLSLRAPSGRGLVMLDADGQTNVLTGVHNDWHRIRRMAESFRRGQLAGVTGSMIRDVVIVANRGSTAVMALRFVYLALCKDATATLGRRAGIHQNQQRRIKFLTTVDPVRAAAVVADSDPGATLVITLETNASSKHVRKNTTAASSDGDDDNDNDETSVTSRMLRTWLLSHLGQGGRRPSEVVLKKHMMWVAANQEMATAKHHKPESVFVVPAHSQTEPFATLSAATLLPLAVVFGWPVVEQFLAGAHDMDCHFVETNPRHNLPVLLALTDVWNDSCFPDGTAAAAGGRDDRGGNRHGGGAAGRIVTPFTEVFAAYPAFVAALESQTCGRSTASSSSRPSQQSTVQSCAPIVVDGGLHGMYDRCSFQSSKALPSELVMTLNSQLTANLDPKQSSRQLQEQEEVNDAQDALICSLFAHADELAFGSINTILSENSPPFHPNLNDSKDLGYATFCSGTTNNGNRPSTLLLCDKLDAFACGQFVAMAEHRALVKAWIWDIDPFSLESGASLRSKRLNSLQSSLRRMIVRGTGAEGEGDDVFEEEAGADLNLSTKTILRHYANMVSSQRIYEVKS